MLRTPTEKRTGPLHERQRTMPNPVAIENIEEMRSRQGIEDTELQEEIRGLRVGDLVRLTLLPAPKVSETLAVRITSISGSSFRGKLAERPASIGLATLRLGAVLTFTAAHIHSL